MTPRLPILLALTALAPLRATPPDAVPDPAEALLREAALNSPLLLEQELHIAQADAFRFRGWRQHMPYINAQYQAGYFHLLNSADPYAAGQNEGRVGGSYGIAADYPVYRWGAIEAEKKYAFARENLARTEAVVAWRNLATDLRAKFLDAVVLKARIRILDKKAVHAARRLGEAERQLKLGRILEIECAARRLEARDATLDAERHKIDLAARLARLRAAAGSAALTVESLPATLPDLPHDLAELERRFAEFKRTGRDDEPERRAARHADAMYAHQRVMAEARDLPWFNLGASVNQTPVERNGRFGMQTYFFAGLTGSWNIFDRDTTRENVRSFVVARRLVEARLGTDSARRETELRNALDQLRATGAALALRRDIAQLRRDAFANTRRRVDDGLAPQTEADTAEVALLEAEMNLLADTAEMHRAYHAFLSGILLSPADTFYLPPSPEH